MLQNRQNQVAAIQIAARRNLNQVALVAGAPHFLSMSKHRVSTSMYGKRPTSPTQPRFDSRNLIDSGDQLGAGSGGERCYRSRLRNSAATSQAVLRESERQCSLSRQCVGQRISKQVVDVPVVTASKPDSMTTATTCWQPPAQIPATAWAAFAIQKAIRG